MSKYRKNNYDYDDDCDYCRSDLGQLQAQLELQQQTQEQLQAQLQRQQQTQEQLQLQVQAQAQIQAQGQAQTDTDTSSFTNIGNPTQTVNVNLAELGGRAEAGKLVEFAFDTQNSTDSLPVIATLLLNTPTIVADVTLNGLAAGNLVWLNGIFHLSNETTSASIARIKIYKDSIVPANIIYNTLVEIDSAFTNDDDFNQIMTVMHVDSATTNKANAKYFLTAERINAGANIVLSGPITFTAAEIKG
ncbi:hypothetical protein [Sporosarcina beigongshangi]|uniref:hypothetical protein n=1 Tax=Sporosarcina beigongshangi TaxID=2782538 RepID=UPI00193A1FC1|nr:hypothetical protein [Sporosarcina beigongshangi]